MMKALIQAALKLTSNCNYGIVFLLLVHAVVVLSAIMHTCIVF
jgi:hypothetical protein